MSKIAITGASGMLGRAVAEELSKSGSHALSKLAYSRTREGYQRLDLTDAAAVETFFDEHRPDIVVHCAAERRPDISEKDPEGTNRLNVDSSRLLAELCQNHGTWLIYISTDYVFDGSQPPYTTSDSPNPLNLYGKTKLAGEQAVALECPQAMILRVPVLFGAVETLSESAVTIIGQAVASPNPQSLDHWSVRYPTYTSDVASVIAQSVEQHLTGNSLAGIFHWSAPEAFTKYEIALKIGELWGMDCSHLSPDSRPPSGAPRPRDCHLDPSELQQRSISKCTPFEQALAASIGAFKPAI